MARNYLLWLCGIVKARYYSNAVSQFRPGSERSFGVRQLAAALAQASLLAGNCSLGRNPGEQARGAESGSKLPHSKAARDLRYVVA